MLIGATVMLMIRPVWSKAVRERERETVEVSVD